MSQNHISERLKRKLTVFDPDGLICQCCLPAITDGIDFQHVEWVDANQIFLAAEPAAIDEWIAVVTAIDKFNFAVRTECRTRLAQRNKLLHRVQQRIFIRKLSGYIHAIFIHRQIELVCVGFREAGVFAYCPLHRCARAGAVEAALLGGQIGAIRQTNLVHNRRTEHRAWS